MRTRSTEPRVATRRGPFRVSAKRALGIALICFLIGSVLNGLLSIYIWTTAAFVYTKDLLEGYLLAWAIGRRIDPYLPLRELATLRFGQLPQSYFDHPTPFPPPLGLLLYPITLLDYPTAGLLWLGLEVVFLFVTFCLLGRELGLRRSTVWAFAFTLASTAWFPVTQSLERGQVSTLELLLLAGAWTALRAGDGARSGLLLSLSLLVKPIAWPCVLVLLVYRQWRGLAGALGVTALGYLVGPMRSTTLRHSERARALGARAK